MAITMNGSQDGSLGPGFPKNFKRIPAYRGFEGPAPFDPDSGQKLGLRPTAPITLFEVLEEKDEYLLCKGYDALERYYWNEVAVAKPYLLQVTPFDGETVNGVTYTYTGATERTAATDDYTIKQMVTPPYYVGDIIASARSFIVEADHTGLRDDDGAPVEWLDMNFSGRHWASGTHYQFTLTEAFSSKTANADLFEMDGTAVEEDVTINLPSLWEDTDVDDMASGDSGVCVFQEDQYWFVVAPCGSA